MKTQTAKLTALLALYLQQDNVHAVSQQELLQAVNDIEKAIITLPLQYADPLLLTQEIDGAIKLLTSLLFNLGYGVISIPNKKLVMVEMNRLCRKLARLTNLYGCAHTAIPQTGFLSPASFLKALQQVQQRLQQDETLAEIYTLLHPELQSVISNKELSYPRWIWWSNFIVSITKEPSIDPKNLEQLLVRLNYNTQAFKQWMAARLHNV
jgi:hypothetical protein